MKLLFASDSFKGTLSSEQTIELLTKAAHGVFGECECSGVPVADGGEGTVEAVVKARGGRLISVPVHGRTGHHHQLFDLGKALTAREDGQGRRGGQQRRRAPQAPHPRLPPNSRRVLSRPQRRRTAASGAAPAAVRRSER